MFAKILKEVVDEVATETHITIHTLDDVRAAQPFKYPAREDMIITAGGGAVRLITGPVLFDDHLRILAHFDPVAAKKLGLKTNLQKAQEQKAARKAKKLMRRA